MKPIPELEAVKAAGIAAGLKLRTMEIWTARTRTICLYEIWVRDARKLFRQHLRQQDTIVFPAIGITLWMEYHPAYDAETEDFIWDDDERIWVQEILKVRNDRDETQPLKLKTLRERWMAWSQYERMA